ncbi:MAG: hypothetical protein JWQ81_6037 [Amycolatopsis sp.]|jgi:hypothetical protein|uniref:hypothetical protein n=1 Tax=Amycolatopsis sp. TaxID=37632 RepID=UPI00262E7F68|nr:hypothetical protein [Amycolatopsis sp.]MCU1685298.1 hypothetical protein [Amycolatopsis sp.]
MSGGYTADTDALASASKTVGHLAEDLLNNNPDLSTTPLTADGFGKAHGQHSQKYTTGAQALWDSVNGYSSTLSGYGSTLGAGAKSYGQSDSSQSGSITNAGAE